jgi:hypothetical protein
MLVITTLIWLGWGHLSSVMPWPLLTLLTVGIIFTCCVPLTALLARTPLAVPLTGRRRAPWPGLGKRDLRDASGIPGQRLTEAARLLPVFRKAALSL